MRRAQFCLGLTTGALVVLAAGCGDSVLGRSVESVTEVRPVPIAPIGGGNALTLPAQRHLVRIRPRGGAPHWLLAAQQDGAGGHGLGFLRSDDEARTFSYYAPIQDDPSHRDTADLIAVGDDVALVYSYEGPLLFGSARHDVYFQWWRWRAGDWHPQPAVRVFDSPSNATGFYRAELARDSKGRLWVQAFRIEHDGSATAAISVSTDGGQSFVAQAPLGTFPVRGGGRLLALGTRLLFVWDGHDAFSPARFRIRDDDAPPATSTWQPAQVAFADGIYHGAALSAVADGVGGMHLVYKDKNEQLWWRHFDGRSFGPRSLVEPAGGWELQPAITRIGSDVLLYYNPVVATGLDDLINARWLARNVLGVAATLDTTHSFKGYPSAAELLPADAVTAPAVFGVAADANVGGKLQLYTLPLGVAQPSAGDAGVVDPGSPALPPPGSTLFGDDFGAGLGPQWASVGGHWIAYQGVAMSDANVSSRLAETVTACADCRVSARVDGFGVPLGLFVRAPSPMSGTRYELVLLDNGNLRIFRIDADGTTLLGQAPSGIADLHRPATLSLAARGAGPVDLVAIVDGTTKLVTMDTSNSALVGTGYAGVWTEHAGVTFDDFVLRAVNPVGAQ